MRVTRPALSGTVSEESTPTSGLAARQVWASSTQNALAAPVVLIVIDRVVEEGGVEGAVHDGRRISQAPDAEDVTGVWSPNCAVTTADAGTQTPIPAA